MRNVSTPHQEKYQTADGNVTVTNFKPRMWQVHPRGHAPFTVGSKQEAFKQAIGISTRHWGLPKAEAFPPRKSAAAMKTAARVHHAARKSPAQLDREIAETLAHSDAKGAKERSEHLHIQVGSHVELPARSSYRAEGDTHGDVVKIRGNAAFVRMDSGRMDWFKLADLRPASGRRSHATKTKTSNDRQRRVLGSLAANGAPRVLKISRGKTFAGQRSITADVQYPGEKPSRVEFVGPSIGGPGPVVMISRPSGHQTFVTDPSRFGDFVPNWVRRFFETA